MNMVKAQDQVRLKWDQIKTSNYKTYDNLTSIIPALLEKHQERILREPEFNYIMEDIKEYEETKNKIEFSLNEEVRKKERETREAKRKAREEAREKLNTIELIDKKEVTKKSLES